jgi:PAS domain S-box-containing protein
VLARWAPVVWSLMALSHPVVAEPTRAPAAPSGIAATDAPGDEPIGHLRFRVFAGADGLSNQVVTSIAQDDDGLLWIGTEDGVYRFNGERFTHFSDEDGLSSSLVHVVGVAPDGAVCVGSSTGLACWNGVQFVRAALPSMPILNMARHAGKLWVGTDGHGLYVRGADGALAPAPGWPGPTATVRALWADADGLVVGNGATVELSAGDGAWRSIGDVGLARDVVEGVLRDRDGALWIRTPGHMWQLPRGATRAVDLHDGFPTGFDATGAPAAMAIGPLGDVLIGTDDGVAYRAGGRWRMIDHTVGMPTATTRALLVDRDGTIWIGAAGLFRLRGRGLFEHHNVASGLPGEVVWTYQRDRNGTLWVGTNRCLARAVAGRWDCLRGTEGRSVRALVFPPQGGVFIGGAPSDLLYIDPDGRSISLGETNRPDRNIFALALGPEGDLWIATRRGLDRLRGAVPGPLVPVAVPDLHGAVRFGSLVVVDGRLWTTAAPGGVAVLDRGAWHVFGAPAGFRSSSMSYLIARSDGRLCTTYSEAFGATCFRYDRGAVSQLEHLGTAGGLSADMVYFLGEDRERRLWVGTGDGVDVVTAGGIDERSEIAGGIDHFDDSDGLAGNDSASQAFLLDRDGTLWLGATGGATHVFTQHYRGPPRPPRTALVKGTLGNRPIVARRDALTGLEVGHDHGALTVVYAASTLADPRRIEYQFRLSPLEPAWSATRQREARYPALLPNKYRFEVRARINSGAWGPATELGFAVLPAWWQTRWFLTLTIVAGLLWIGAAFAWRQRIVLRRRTRQLHQQSEASFHAVVDLMPDLITVFRDGALVYMNLAKRRFLGLDEADARWRDIDVLERVHPDDRAQVVELLARVRDLAPSHAADIIEIRIRSADGWRACEISGVTVDIGGARTVVISGRDSTERKRLRAKLLVSDRMASLGTLAAGIAHEINNPLAYVTGNLEAAAESLSSIACAGAGRQCRDHAEAGAAIGDARDGAERVRKIVHSLRLFSRSEEEKRVPLALSGVIEAAIRMTASEVRHRAQLAQELGPVPLVVADDGQLTQVFINLIVNAAHAIPEGRYDANRITIRTRTDAEGRAVIEVEDTGEGIAPELRSRVFDPFFTTKEVGGGTGLGLSICHGIVSGLGGTISIDERSVLIDSAPERGTLVRVVLPPAADLPSAPPATAGDQDPATDAQKRRRVMLVDDEPQVAHTMERLLRRDYDVTIALCGQDALDHIARGMWFDAIVSDVMMPNMTGIELLEQLQRSAPEQAARLVFLSGGAFTAATRERLDQLGVFLLEKPVTAKDLRATVLRIATEGEPPRGAARR